MIANYIEEKWKKTAIQHYSVVATKYQQQQERKKSYGMMQQLLHIAR